MGIGLSDDHPQAQAVRHFAERLAAKSGGKMNAKVFASGALGNDVSMTSALRGGTLEMTVPDSSTLMSLIKPFGVLNLPLPELVSLMGRAWAAGIAPAVHAIGDEAVDMALDAFEHLAREQQVSALGGLAAAAAHARCSTWPRSPPTWAPPIPSLH